MDLSYEAELVNKSIDISYQESRRKASENVVVTKQTVMNSIRKLGSIENSDVSINNKEDKKIVKTLVMQNSINKEINWVINRQ